MAELNHEKTEREVMIRYLGRGSQVTIYFGKLLRMFVYQNDWKLLPMSVLVAGLVGMVTQPDFFISMEGTLFGSFAMVCVCIWNGCFNSIQVICRERDVIKREHRSGMHISSYIFSHMLYQALLCLAQAVITLYVTAFVGVHYPAKGLITPFFMLDFIISMFLITYASDMLSLWISSLAHSTTAAMTIMPFVLIFQLVFSGGMIPLPEWTEPLTHFTISSPALKLTAAQADTNNRPYATISDMVGKMRDNEVGGTFTLGQAMAFLQDEQNAGIAELRAEKLGAVITVRELKDALEHSAEFDAFKKETILENYTVGDLLEAIDARGLTEQYGDLEIGGTITAGEAVDLLASYETTQAGRDTEITVKTTVGKLLDIAGEENVKTYLKENAAAVSYNEDYVLSTGNVWNYWLQLSAFILAFALLSTITLEFIDKDKR